MPLTAINFVPKGPIRSADMKQFVDLFTGVMLDQPITFRNAVIVGGNNSPTTAALSLYGATNQTGNLLNLYPDTTSQNPTFGFAASGEFGWGAGGALVQDTFLSRIGTQNGHATDTAGLLIQPNLEVTGTLTLDGPISVDGVTIGGASGVLDISPDLLVSQHLYVGNDKSSYITQGPPGGILDVEPRLTVHGANAALYGLTTANAHLQVRSDDLPDTAGTYIPVFSGQTFAANWLQFNVGVYVISTGTGWPGEAMLLEYTVDATAAAGGRISMAQGRHAVGSGGVVDPAGDTLQVLGTLNVTQAATIGGALTVSGALTIGGGTINGNVNITGTVGIGQNLSVGSNIQSGARITAGTDLVVGNGNLFLGSQGDTYLNRSAAGSVGVGSNLVVAGAVTAGGNITCNALTANSALQVGSGQVATGGTIRLPEGAQILWWSGGNYGLWIDGGGTFNLEQGQPLAGGATGGSVGVPGQCRGFLQINISGVGLIKIPVYNN